MGRNAVRRFTVPDHQGQPEGQGIWDRPVAVVNRSSAGHLEADQLGTRQQAPAYVRQALAYGSRSTPHFISMLAYKMPRCDRYWWVFALANAAGSGCCWALSGTSQLVRS